MKVLFEHNNNSCLFNDDDNNFGKILKNDNINIQSLPSAYDYEINDLTDYIIYGRIGKNILRIHKIEKNTGLVEFNFVSMGNSITEEQLHYLFNNIINSLPNKEK